MTRRVWFHLTWAMLAVVGIALDVVARLPDDQGVLVWPLGLAVFPMVGALILMQRPGNSVGLLFALVGVTAGVFSGAYWASLRWFDTWWSPWAELVGNLGFCVAFWGMVSVLHLFPSGVTRPGFFRRAYAVFTGAVLGPGLVMATVSDATMNATGRPNPAHVGALDVGGSVGVVLLMLAAGAAIGVGSLVVRFRRSDAVERAQMKVFLTGVAAFVAIAVAAFGIPVPESGDPWWINLLGLLGFMAVPVAITVAILRYRLWDIDRVVSRTVTYVVTLGVLGGVYAGLAIGLRGLLPVSGDLPVALSTLTVAFGFLPVARKVQRVVDRRFFRSRYDAASVVARVAEDLRGSLDLNDVTGRAETVLGEVFRPEVVGLWVAEGMP